MQLALTVQSFLLTCFFSLFIQFQSKGYSVYVIAANDPFVMGAWGTQNKAEDKIVFATDLGLEFSKAVSN